MDVDDFPLLAYTHWLTLIGSHPQTQHAVALRMHLEVHFHLGPSVEANREAQYSTVR